MNTEITTDYLIIELGLYEPITINDDNAKTIESFFKQNNVSADKYQFDSYCTECQKDSTFKFWSQYGSLPSYSVHNFPEKPIQRIKSDTPINLMYKCQRNNSHMYSFTYVIKGKKLTKIGQYPSIADLELHRIEKYRKILKSDYRDFSKAIGLFSHGIGAGSFVYLRRIFENLIEENRLNAAQKPNWDNLEFEQARMDEKIKILQEYLPNILVENRKLYSILSKGIHELSEDECLELFPKVQLAIELILDEKIHELEKIRKLQTVKDFVSETVGKFKS